MDKNTPVKKTYITNEFNITGINNIDIYLVVKNWNHLWFLSQYGAEFRLVKYYRKNSDKTTLKTEISAIQANKLIEKLGLGAIKSGVFRKGVTWKREQDL